MSRFYPTNVGIEYIHVIQKYISLAENLELKMRKTNKLVHKVYLRKVLWKNLFFFR